MCNDLVERVAESRRRREAEMLALLREVAASAERGLGRARDSVAAGTETVRRQADRLAEIRARLEALQPPPQRGGP